MVTTIYLMLWIVISHSRRRRSNYFLIISSSSHVYLFSLKLSRRRLSHPCFHQRHVSLNSFAEGFLFTFHSFYTFSILLNFSGSKGTVLSIPFGINILTESIHKTSRISHIIPMVSHFQCQDYQLLKVVCVLYKWN